jgi:hypothetical protein
VQVLWSIPGADITNNESLLGTVTLNLIFIFGLLVRCGACHAHRLGRKHSSRARGFGRGCVTMCALGFGRSWA